MDVLPILSLAVSAAALGVAGVTARNTVLRRGHLQARWPSMVYLGPDGRSGGPPKIVLRFLLFTGGARGKAIEHIMCGSSSAIALNHSACGSMTTEMGWLRGSGLHVPATGIPAYHHFLLSKSETNFQFAGGEAVVEVYAKPVGNPATRILRVGPLVIRPDHAEAMRSGAAGLFFDWSSDANSFDTHLDSSEPLRTRTDLLRLMGISIPEPP